MTIRATVNATTKSIRRSGMKGEGIELANGSIDGIADAANVEQTEASWDALKAGTPANTLSVIHSREHYDGNVKTA